MLPWIGPDERAGQWEPQMEFRKLWAALAAVVIVSFAVLIGVGVRAVRNGPPIPTRVEDTNGRVLFEGQTIMEGQNVWQSLGGQEIGSIFGHGAYVAPDWTADWLHRESIAVLDGWARTDGARDFESLDEGQKAALLARLRRVMRHNGYDPKTGTLTIDPARADAFPALAEHYASIFRDGRNEYAIARGTLEDPETQRRMAAFFFWTAWASAAERPGTNASYTQNWPHEELVGNRPTGGALVWSVASFVLLLAGVGGMVFYFASKGPAHEPVPPPHADPLLGLRPTPSQRATAKYFFVVAALWVVQVGLGAITAHYGVEGSGFYGIPLDRVLPYAIARTFHLQLGIFWIATSWLATGLYVAPAVSGHEPPRQRLFVDVLFYALLFIVVGSLAGEWLGMRQRLGKTWFWFGSQGYEYLDLGRFFQILLFVGLCFWLWLVFRALRPALARPSESRPLFFLFTIASLAIALFYAAGLLYGQRTPLVTAEYFRWWVVHLWVEGFFEVFTTVVIAFLFTRLELLSVRSATFAVLFSTVVFLSGGVVGTFHHLYFTGMPEPVLALGAIFSALEVVPLVLVGFEAWQNIRITREENRAPWISAYRWPIRFFVAVAFWNFVGAGLFGFFINPPIALYYMQGLNTTSMHAHTALFGVYGMLALGLMLFCLRALRPGAGWKEWPLAFAFWLINGGLSAMVLFSLLPIGLLQGFAAVERGTWYARSAEFMQTSTMNALRWTRVFGDSVFALGALLLGIFVLGLWTGHSYDPRKGRVVPGELRLRFGPRPDESAAE